MQMRFIMALFIGVNHIIYAIIECYSSPNMYHFKNGLPFH